MAGCKSDKITEKDSSNQTVQKSKILAAYFSVTGNTEAIAEMICETIATFPIKQLFLFVHLQVVV